LASLKFLVAPAPIVPYRDISGRPDIVGRDERECDKLGNARRKDGGWIVEVEDVDGEVVGGVSISMRARRNGGLQNT